jgi:hypothetical protein
MKVFSAAFLGGILAQFCAGAQELRFDAPFSLGAINTDKVTEASGIAASRSNPGVFWTHNDGPSDHIYAFSFQGALLGDFDFSKNPNDVEDIAPGPGPNSSLNYLYIGDIGSNNADRESVHIYRLAEPAVDRDWAADPVSMTIKDGVENFQLRYPSGKFDAEALLVDPVDQALYIATKEPDQTHVFRILLNQLADDETRDLQFVLTLQMGKINGGSISSDGRIIALRHEESAMAWLRNPGETVSDALARPGMQIPVVGPPNEPNGESISFLPDNSGYITLSEGENQPIYFFRRLTGECNETAKFSRVRIDNGRLQLDFTACPGATVALQRTSNFSEWQDIGSAILNNGAGSFSEDQIAQPSYYRLRVVAQP